MQFATQRKMSEKITEKESVYKHLESMNVIELLTAINDQDKCVPLAVEKVLHRIETVVILIINAINVTSLGYILHIHKIGVWIYTNYG